jgi:hypothetical protein
MAQDEAAMSGNNKMTLLRNIQESREAFAACPEGHPNRGWLAARLGSQPSISYERFGNVTVINEAIEVERVALALHPQGHPD